MKKYYGFNGCDLVFIGEYETISYALEAADNMEDLFYVTTLEDWGLFAKRIIDELTFSVKK